MNQKRIALFWQGILRLLFICVFSSLFFISGNIHAQNTPSYLVADYKTGKVLIQREGTERRMIGDLTKIATALVVLDWASATHTSLEKRVKIPLEALSYNIPNPLGFQPGDVLSIRDALYATLIASDHIASGTLASHVGRDLLRRNGKKKHPVSYFVKQMNALAARLKCEKTRFTNPSGLDNSRPIPYSCVRDVARFGLHTAARPKLMFFVSQKSRTLQINRQGQKISKKITNANPLLGKSRIDGIKTGFTSLAGHCVLLTADRPVRMGGPPGYPDRLIIVILRATSSPSQMARGLLASGWQELDKWAKGGRIVRSSNELLTPPKRRR